MKLRKKSLRTTVFEYSSEEEVIANNLVVSNDEEGENSNKFQLNANLKDSYLKN